MVIHRNMAYRSLGVPLVFLQESCVYGHPDLDDVHLRSIEHLYASAVLREPIMIWLAWSRLWVMHNARGVMMAKYYRELEEELQRLEGVEEDDVSDAVGDTRQQVTRTFVYRGRVVVMTKRHVSLARMLLKTSDPFYVTQVPGAFSSRLARVWHAEDVAVADELQEFLRVRFYQESLPWAARIMLATGTQEKKMATWAASWSFMGDVSAGQDAGRARGSDVHVRWCDARWSPWTYHHVRMQLRHQGWMDLGGHDLVWRSVTRPK